MKIRTQNLAEKKKKWWRLLFHFLKKTLVPAVQMKDGNNISRKRKLGGNARDHRPYFTHWVTFVQVKDISQFFPQYFSIFLNYNFISFWNWAYLFSGWEIVSQFCFDRSQCMVWIIPPLQVAIMFISLLLYGFGPIGVDLYKRSSMVSRQQDELDDQMAMLDLLRC